MFYVCDEKDGKYGVKDIQDGIVEYLDRTELFQAASKVTILGVFLKSDKVKIVDIDEYQELDWGTHRIFSYYNKSSNNIGIYLENKQTSKVYRLMLRKSYLNEDITSTSTPRNGHLEWIFDEGKENKCAGVDIWLDFKYNDSGKSDQRAFELYFEIYPDGEISIIETTDWDFDECGGEYYYDEEKDRISYGY